MTAGTTFTTLTRNTLAAFLKNSSKDHQFQQIITPTSFLNQQFPGYQFKTITKIQFDMDPIYTPMNQTITNFLEINHCYKSKHYSKKRSLSSLKNKKGHHEKNHTAGERRGKKKKTLDNPLCL